MSLTLYQLTNDLDGSLHYPHSVYTSTFATVLSNVANAYYDFKYIFTIYDELGDIITIEKTPAKNLLGVLNPNSLLKDYVDNLTFKSENNLQTVQSWKAYKIKVQEYYDGDLHDTAEYPVALASSFEYNFNNKILPYEIVNERVGNWYVNQPMRNSRQSMGTHASWLFPTDENDTNLDEIIYQIKFTKNGNNEIYEYSINITNPYSFDTTTINNASESIKKIIVGFKDLQSQLFNKKRFRDMYGNWHTLSGTQTGIDSNKDDTWKRDKLTVALSYNDTVYPDSVYSWDLIDCDNKDITIMWKNVYGGIDFFNFNKVRKDKIKNKRKTYKHNNFDFINNKYLDNWANENTKVYTSDKSYELEVKSDLLSKNEIQHLKGLFYSDDIYMYIDDMPYPVVAIEDTHEILSKEKPGFAMYKFKIKYGK